MVAIPAPAAVERDDEAVAALEFGERLGAALLAQHRVGEFAANLVGDRRAQQEIAEIRGQGREHLVREVVGDGAVVTAEIAHHPVRVVALAQ